MKIRIYTELEEETGEPNLYIEKGNNILLVKFKFHHYKYKYKIIIVRENGNEIYRTKDLSGEIEQIWDKGLDRYAVSELYNKYINEVVEALGINTEKFEDTLWEFVEEFVEYERNYSEWEKN